MLEINELAERALQPLQGLTDGAQGELGGIQSALVSQVYATLALQQTMEVMVQRLAKVSDPQIAGNLRALVAEVHELTQATAKKH